MSTKTKKTSESRGSVTPVPKAARPSSPLSPTRHSRLLEKTELQNLNDRLACYIDRVRNLETENSRLAQEVHTSRESVTREITNIKSMYEREVSDTRKLLDETSSERAKLEIDAKRLWEENEELKVKLDKKIKEYNIADNNSRLFETRCTELNTKYNTALADRKKAAEEAKELKKENDHLRKQFNEIRKNLEEETLARVDLENTVQSLREELTFKDQIHSQELSETRTHREVQISEIDGRLSEQYEAKLQQSLQELREQYEAQMLSNREEMEVLYENKLKSLQAAALRSNNAASAAMEEIRSSRTKIDNLNSRISELNAINASLNTRIQDLDGILVGERELHAKDVRMLQDEISHLREEMERQLQEYRDLMDIKVSLDLEIAAYDKLLQGEESRLNIQPTNGTSSSSSFFNQSLSGKRKRTLLEESENHDFNEFKILSSAKGDIEIIETDAEGNFVKIKNKGNKEIAIGGWQLFRVSGNNKTVHKFHRNNKIDAGAIVTVWSSDVGANHEPPSNIVMKTQHWVKGDTMKTVLLNSDGEEAATMERVKQKISSSKYHETSMDKSGQPAKRSSGGPLSWLW